IEGKVAAKVFGRELGVIVDITRARLQCFSHTYWFFTGMHSMAIDRGSAGIDKAPHTSLCRRFQQIERSGDIGSDKSISGVDRHLGLMERSSVDNGIHTAYHMRKCILIIDTHHMLGPQTRHKIHAYRLMGDRELT